MRNALLKWNPKKDITAFELAVCLPLILQGENFVHDARFIDASILKHFKVVEVDPF